ncbi:MAG: hypothetical protein WCS84_11910 [Nocardioides sp.]
MRSLPALLCATALVLITGCTADEEPDQPDRPVTVALTGEERDAFVAQVEDLGYTCRDAVPETDRYVACTRPGAYPDATHDTVQISSTPDGATVTRLVYCGPEAGVVAAMSGTFLGEVGSPDLLPELPAVDGIVLRQCVSTVGTGVAIGGPGLPYLRQLEVELLERGLTRAGWTCRDDLTVDCRSLAGGNRTLVWGTDQEILVSAPTPQALAAATRVLALSPVVAEAATDCAPDTVCEHLVVDGFDMFFDVADEVSRVRIKVRRDF